MMRKMSHCFRESQPLSLVEAAEVRGCTRQALYYAIKNNTLQAYKENGHWRVTVEDLIKYDDELYSRMKRSKFNGQHIYDKEKGRITVALAADMVGSTKQNIYYSIRTKKLKAKKVNGAIVINVKDLVKYKNPVTYGCEIDGRSMSKTQKRFYALFD